MEKFLSLSVNIDRNQVYRRIGGTFYERSSPRTRWEVTEAIETIHGLADPRGIYKIFPVETDHRFIHLNGETTLESRRFAKVLSHCRKAAVFVLTLGPEVDCFIQENTANCLHYSTILDAAASVSVESSAMSMQDLIEDMLPEDEGVTMRYSPGYCDWPLKEQERLFGVLPPTPAGVRLSRDYLMSPRKSVSGIVGIGPSEIVKKHGNACLECPRTDCLYRRE